MMLIASEMDVQCIHVCLYNYMFFNSYMYHRVDRLYK